MAQLAPPVCGISLPPFKIALVGLKLPSQIIHEASRVERSLTQLDS